MESYLLPLYLGLLLTACTVAVAAQYARIPYTIALVFVGLVAGLFRAAPELVLTRDVVFHVILPPLLFYGALHTNLEDLRKNWKLITLLAVPGVVLSTFLIGWGAHLVWGVGLLTGLLFGAMITPTDPISVLAVIRSVGAPKRLRIVLEGESLFNDGTGVVLYSLILSMILSPGAFRPAWAVPGFLLVAGGGAAVGAGLGLAAHSVLKRIDNHLIEVTLTIVLAFGTPLVAEAVHCSGVIAVVAAGLVIGNYGRFFAMSPKTRMALDHFWEVADFIVNSFLFTAIGLELQVVRPGSLGELWWQALAGVALVLVGRAAAVYPMFWTRRLIKDDPVPDPWVHVFFWGGLKGAIPLALVAGLPQDFPHRELLLVVSFSAVLASLGIQGLTMKPLLRSLGLAAKG